MSPPPLMSDTPPPRPIRIPVLRTSIAIAIVLIAVLIYRVLSPLASLTTTAADSASAASSALRTELTPTTRFDPRAALVELRGRHLLVVHTTEIDIADTGVSDYRTGVARARGSVDYAVSCAGAEFTDVSETARTLTLVLPRPMPYKARLDDTQIQIGDITNDGLGKWTLGLFGSDARFGAALRASIRDKYVQVVRDPARVREAQSGAQALIDTFYKPVGWRATIRWRDEP